MEFTNGLDSDPIEEIENYKKYRKYNSALADLIIPLISQTLKMRIVILELDEETEMYNLSKSKSKRVSFPYKPTTSK